MRWNIVIGGQLFSKSFLGYTIYKMVFATRGGLLASIAFLILPFLFLGVLVKLLPPGKNWQRHLGLDYSEGAMDKLPTEIEARQLEELIQSVDDLRRRVAALERQSMPEPESAPTPIEFVGAPANLSPGLLAALGRLLLGVAGAYLLRAITEANFLPQLAGTLAGLL